MKGYNYWSYKPYKAPLSNVGDPYICRLAPSENAIHVEWLGNGGQVFFRKRNEGDYALAGETEGNELDITGLETDTDYELYVTRNGSKSRVRLFRAGKGVGVTVNYLHPEDNAYCFSGGFIASPSMVRHPDGHLLASMDVFHRNTPQNLTFIFRSDDDGKTWHHVCELMPCFWGKLFIHKGEVYMLSVNTEYGDLLIGKSTDGGNTFCAPVTLLRGSNGKRGFAGVHKNPQPVVVHNGRIYESLEWGTWENKEYGHAAMVMSADVDSDLLDPESWSFTEPLKFGHFAPELEHLPMNTMTIEGCLTVSPDGKLYNIMRFGMEYKVLAYEVDPIDHEAPLKYSHLIELPTVWSKFMIKPDPVSGKYYSVITRMYDGNPHFRELLSLVVSDDMENWSVVKDIYDYRGYDQQKHGFQYVDFSFEGNDIIFLCRTGINNPNNYHDSNYITFDRIENFRSL